MAASRAYDGTRYMTSPVSLGGLQKLTMAAWWYTTTAVITTIDIIISANAGLSRLLFERYYDGTNNRFYCGINNSSGHAQVNYTGLGWHHFALTFDGTDSTQANRMKLYVDGTLLAFNGGSNTPGTTVPSGTVEIGRDSGATSYKSKNGTGLAHLLFFNATLTASQLQDVMWRPDNPPVQPLAYYPMLSDGVTTEPDIVGNSDGTWVSSVGDLTHGPNVSLGKGGR